MNQIHFPNGARSYLETFYEVSQYFQKNAEHEALVEILKNKGKDGLYSLAIAITNEFELTIKGQMESNADIPYHEALQFFITFKLKDAI